MQIIPVLDLKNGTVVRAQMGERDRYRPIETPLADEPAIRSTSRAGCLSVYPFQTLYIADLDAIEGRGNNEAAIGRLRRAFPDLCAVGRQRHCRSMPSASAWLATRTDCLVLGSETQRDPKLVRELSDHRARRPLARLSRRAICRASPIAGRTEHLAAAADRDDLGTGRQRCGTRHGAGCRDPRPRRMRVPSMRPAACATRAISAVLQQLGVAGALVATSLHDGRLTGADIARFEKP